VTASSSDGLAPLVMGIVNANPGSFSTAGRVDHGLLHPRGLEQLADGADVIDVGGESGVTYQDETAARAERDRVVPVIEGLVPPARPFRSTPTSAGGRAALAAGSI